MYIELKIDSNDFPQYFARTVLLIIQLTLETIRISTAYKIQSTICDKTEALF